MHSLSVYKRLEKIIEKVKSDQFLAGRGCGNEISYYIFDYDPKEELVVREYVRHIIKEFSKSTSNRTIIEIDLYKLFIAFLKDEGDFETIIQMELAEGREAIFEAITPFLTPNVYSQKIREMAAEYQIIFLTGVGKIYPFMRSHNILNQLQQYMGKKPLVIFYPGQYSGQDLTLFGKFKDENYYRAFPLI